jgi:hypothetical protein
MLTIPDLKRIADIRMKNLIASTEFDTSYWESTFFLRVIDELLHELKG